MTKLTGIKAVSFDVDGTLWDFEGAMRRSLRQVLLELAWIDPEAAAVLDVDRMIAIRERVHDDWVGPVPDLEDVRRESFWQTLRDIGRPDDALASRLSNVYFQHRYADNGLFDEVLPVLEELSRSYLIGLISNGNSYPERLGLESMVRFAAYAQDCGAEKPDPRIFEVALEKAGCSPRELLHVGDSLEHDVAGARTAGSRSVWLNRNGHERGSGIEPDREVSSLRELLELL